MLKVTVEPHVQPAIGSGHPSEPIIERLQADPRVQRVPTAKLAMFIRKDFLEPALCDAMIAKIDAQRRPSTVSDYNGDDLFRTSETCDLAYDDPDVVEIDRQPVAYSHVFSM